MYPEDDWNDFAPSRDTHPVLGGLGSLRIALLFGSGAIALALLIVPFVEQRTRLALAGGSDQLDTMATGSIQQRGNTYTIRRSVLQSDPNAVCIIQANGIRTGDC